MSLPAHLGVILFPKHLLVAADLNRAFCALHLTAAAIEEAEDAIVDALVKAGPTPRQQFILIRWAQKAAGALVGVATAAFLLFYQWVVEPAAPNSLRVKAWAQLTNVGVLGATVLVWLLHFDLFC